MTRNLNFKNLDFKVDSESNKRIYDGLKRDSESLEQDEVIKYYLTNRDNLFSAELIEFLKLTGIDLTKENEILHYTRDNTVVVEGWYDIIGKVLTGNRVVSFYWDADVCTTNVHFGNDSRHGICEQLKEFETFRFDFAIIIPKENIIG